MRTLIAIPCHDKTDVAFEMSLYNLKISEEDHVERVVSSLIYDARNELVKKAHQLGAEYILWLDSDMVFTPDLLDEMFKSLGDDEFVSGIYFRRKPPYDPCIFKDCKYLFEDECVTPIADKYFDYPKEERFEVAACGFGCVLMRTSLALDIIEHKGLPFTPMPGFGEDISFCIRAQDCGHKLYCDSRIKVGHIAHVVVDENYYEAYRETLTADK